MIQILLKSFAALTIYFLYRPLIQFAGSFLGLVFSHIVGTGQWLLFWGRNNQTKSAMKQILGRLQPDLKIESTFRRYCCLKHLFFAESYLLENNKDKTRILQRYSKKIQGVEFIDNCLAEKQGAVILFFHFGTAPLIISVLQSLGYEAYEHVRLNVTHQRGIFPWLAKLSARMEKKRVISAVGNGAIFHEQHLSFAKMVRLLQSGKIIGLNGDGMTGENFMEVSFLAGEISFPCGIATLAAYADVPIIPAFSIPEQLFKRKIIFHPPLKSSTIDQKSIREVTEACAVILDRHIRENPWAWWTWRRLECRAKQAETLTMKVRYSPQE